MVLNGEKGNKEWAGFCGSGYEDVSNLDNLDEGSLVSLEWDTSSSVRNFTSESEYSHDEAEFPTIKVVASKAECLTMGIIRSYHQVSQEWHLRI